MAVVEALIAPPISRDRGSGVGDRDVPARVRETAKATPTRAEPPVRAVRVEASEPARAVAAPPVAAVPPPVPAEAEITPRAPSVPVAATLPPTDDEHIVLAESEVMLAEIESLWPQIVDSMKPYNPNLQALLRNCEPIGVDNNTLTIGAHYPLHAGKIEEATNRRLIEDLLFKALTRRMLVRCEFISKEQQSKTRDARRQREDLMKDQTVKAARNIFDARIVGVQEDS